MNWSTILKAAPLRLWALIASGPVLTAATAAMVLIVKSETWPIELRGQQLEYLGWTLLGCLGLNAVIIITLASARVRGTGPGGTSFEIDSDDEQRVAQVTTTTTVQAPPA